MLHNTGSLVKGDDVQYSQLARLGQWMTFQTKETVLTLVAVTTLSAVSTLNTLSVSDILGTTDVSVKQLNTHKNTSTHAAFTLSPGTRV